MVAGRQCWERLLKATLDRCFEDQSVQKGRRWEMFQNVRSDGAQSTGARSPHFLKEKARSTSPVPTPQTNVSPGFPEQVADLS